MFHAQLHSAVCRWITLSSYYLFLLHLQQTVYKAESNTLSDYLDCADKVNFPGLTMCLPA